MDLPPLTNALCWLQQQPEGHVAGRRLVPTDCVLALWLRACCGATEVSIDDQVVRLVWASGWRLTCPTPRDYVHVIERLDWSCSLAGGMAITVCEAIEVIGQVIRDTIEEHWDGPCL